VKLNAAFRATAPVSTGFAVDSSIFEELEALYRCSNVFAAVVGVLRVSVPEWRFEAGTD